MTDRLTHSGADHWVQRARGQVRVRIGLMIALLGAAIGVFVYAAMTPSPGLDTTATSANTDFAGVALVNNGEGTGSAFLVKEKYALTAAHVAGDVGNTVQLQFKDGTQVSGSVVASGYEKLQQYVSGENTVSDGATQHDWALIELSTAQPYEWTVPIATTGSPVSAQAEVLAVGYPGGGEHNVSSGILSGKDPNELRTDAPIDAGHSGGLLYSVQQSIGIGIIVSSPSINGQRATSVSNAVPIGVVVEKCREAGYLDVI